MVITQVFTGSTAQKLFAGVQNYSRLAALIVLVWDYFDTLADEIRFIWKSPLDQPKLTYTFSRYFGIAFQVANIVITILSGIGVSDLPVPHHICQRWHAMQIGGFYILYAVGNANVLMRAYVLHKKSRSILLLLSAMAIVEYTVTIISAHLVLKTLTFDGSCNGLSIHWTVLPFIITFVVNQSVTWFLIWKKLKPYSIIPKGPAIFNGGQWTWFLSAGLIAILIPFSTKNQTSQPHMIFSWPISLMSVGTCRVILSSKKSRHWILHGTQSQGSHDSSSPSDIPLEQTHATIRSGSRIIAVHDDASVIRSYNSSDVGEDDFTTSSQSGSLALDDQRSSSDSIEIGSEHRSSSVDSEELRAYWKDLYNPFPLRHL